MVRSRSPLNIDYSDLFVQVFLLQVFLDRAFGVAVDCKVLHVLVLEFAVMVFAHSYFVLSHVESLQVEHQ